MLPLIRYWSFLSGITNSFFPFFSLMKLGGFGLNHSGSSPDFFFLLSEKNERQASAFFLANCWTVEPPIQFLNS